MSNTTLQALEAEAMKLSAQERADLAERLWLSVPPSDLDGAHWDAEVQRRVAADEAGQTRFMPAQAAPDRLADHLQRRLAERRG